MKVYATVRAMRGIALGAATGNPLAALVTETISCVPLYRDISATLGGVLALVYSGHMAGTTLELLEAPMRKQLETELFLLLLTLVAIVIAPS
jgi:hypothetical protein